MKSELVIPKKAYACTKCKTRTCFFKGIFEIIKGSTKECNDDVFYSIGIRNISEKDPFGKNSWCWQPQDNFKSCYNPNLKFAIVKAVAELE